MTFTTVFLVAIIALIIAKTRDIVLRNNLDAKKEKRLIIASILFILFLVTNATLPYPDSLYWFIGLGIVFSTAILSYDVIKKEFKRFMALETKDKLQNILFYSLLVVVTNIYL
jgi:amino acid transporter